ncbi:hypothetical protein SprV_0501802600 [Sparganum proliferum]
MHLAFRNDCAPILNDFAVNEDVSRCRLRTPSTSQARSGNLKSCDSPAFLNVKCAPSDVHSETNNPKNCRQRTILKRDNQRACSCNDFLTTEDVASYSGIIKHAKYLAKTLRDADLNHLAVDVETVAKRLVFGRKKRLVVAAADTAGGLSKIASPSPDSKCVQRMEASEESTCSCKHEPLPTVNQFNVCDSCLHCVSSQLIHRGVQTRDSPLTPALATVDVAIQNTSPDISSQCSGNPGCEWRSVTPDSNEHNSKSVKESDPTKPRSHTEGDPLSGAVAIELEKKFVSGKSCYLPHASTNSNALVEEDLERVDTSHSNIVPRSTASSLNLRTPHLVVEIEDKERLTEGHDAKAGSLETACRTCRLQLRTISLQLCRRQMEFEVRRTEWDKREKALQEELAKVWSQAEQLARENEDVKRRLVDREAEITQIGHALHLVLEKLSLQQPVGALAHPIQDQSVAGGEFLSLLRTLATRHSLTPVAAVGPDTQQAVLPSGNAAAMSPRSLSVLSDVSMSCGGSKMASTNADAPVIALASSETKPSLVRINNGLSFVQATASSTTGDDLEVDGELDKDTTSNICAATRRPGRSSTAPRAETPLGSLYSSVSSLRTVDEAQFRTGLSALDAQIAKLRLSLVSQ